MTIVPQGEMNVNPETLRNVARNMTFKGFVVPDHVSPDEIGREMFRLRIKIDYCRGTPMRRAWLREWRRSQ